MVENIRVMIFKSIWKDVASFIRLLVPIHPSKMEGCSCFLDSSKIINILLGRSNHICRILDQSGGVPKEIQTLDYDYHIFEEDESGQSELVNQETGELDMSGTTLEPSSNDHSEIEKVIEEGRDSTIEPSPPCEQFGSEDVFTEIPNQSSFVEGVLNLELDPFMKRLPHRHNRALANPRWKVAMNEEMKSLQKNETWELVECPPGKKPIWRHWIYIVKYKADGTKGYTQTYRIDYTRHLHFIRRSIYGSSTGCMVLEKQCRKVCKLKKSLYGLKQSPRAWFGRFTKSMRAFGYRQSNSDHTLFLKKQHGKITTLIVYMDDMIVTGNDPKKRKALQNYLSREFEMKYLGPLKYFLGIEVSRSSEGIFLSQIKYALDLLQETRMSGCQPIDTPIEEGLKLCRLVGRLMYLAHTRPDLAYALSVVSQYMHNPIEQHMNAVMRILSESTCLLKPVRTHDEHQPLITLASLEVKSHSPRSRGKLPSALRDFGDKFPCSVTDANSSTGSHSGSLTRMSNEENYSNRFDSFSSHFSMTMSVMAIDTTSVKKQLAEMARAITKLTKTVEEEDYKIRVNQVKESTTFRMLHLLSMMHHMCTDSDLLVKQFVCSLRGNAFDWYINLAPECIDSWDQMEREFLNSFYRTRRTVSMMELTNTKQWKDDLDCKDRLSKVSAVEMCIQGMHWGLLYSLQGIRPRTFKELAA
ncbi:hypothetical protein AAG906_014631 [Vitis piasezkii]